MSSKTTPDLETGSWPPTPPSPGVVHLWWIDLDPPAPVVDELARLLSPEELRRAARFKFDRHRRRCIVRRGRLRQLCAAYLGIEAPAIEFVLGPKGKPSLAPEIQTGRAPLELNLSDSEDVAVVGFQTGYELGVDVEVVRPMPDAVPISKNFFARAEQDVLRRTESASRDATFFRCWTRKEAYIKAVGEGLSLPLDSFTVSMQAEETPRFLRFEGMPGEEGRWTLAHFEPAPKVFVAVAVRRLGLRFEFYRLRAESGP